MSPSVRTVLLAFCSSAMSMNAGAQATAPAAAPPPTRADIVRRVDSLVADFIATRNAPGVSIAVVRGSDTIVAKGYGKADLEQDVAADARTVYRVGSVTKQFTAAAVMQLVEQGKVKLDDSIATHLTGLPERWRAVTIRQLLNHTSGIPSYTDVGMRWFRRIREPMVTDTIVAITARDTVNFAPGASWRYNNTGYVLLGMLIEKVAGRPYAADMQARFFTPLGLTSTTYCDVGRIIPRRAPGYSKAGDGWRNSDYIDMSQPFSAGALCSTVGDLVRWNRALAEGKVVSAESYRQMTSPSGAAAKGGYGFGLGAAMVEQYRMISHSGGIPGFSVDNAYFPAETLSVVVLPNSDAAQAGRLLRSIARVALGLPIPPPSPPRASR